MSNPLLSNDVRRRAMEIQEEFFDKRKAIEEALPLPGIEDDVQLTPEEQAILDALLAEAIATGVADKLLDDVKPPEGIKDNKTESAWRRIQNLTVSQKVQLAFKGGQTERSILVRARNRLICAAVIRSPRLTDNEVETFAAMRNLEEEALRLIGMNRTWMGKYSIMVTLARNPKAPIAVVLPLINRLSLRDLKTLTNDKGVTEAVRASAKRLYVARKNK
jgi:hypothetical protein